MHCFSLLAISNRNGMFGSSSTLLECQTFFQRNYFHLLEIYHQQHLILWDLNFCSSDACKMIFFGVALIYISLTTGELEHALIYSLVICILSAITYLFRSYSSVFKWFSSLWPNFALFFLLSLDKYNFLTSMWSFLCVVHFKILLKRYFSTLML